MKTDEPILDDNVINAIKLAREKGKHSDFFIKLCLLNEKIFVYRKIFMDKRPKYIQKSPLIKPKDPKRKIRNHDSKPLQEASTPGLLKMNKVHSLSPS